MNKQSLVVIIIIGLGLVLTQCQLLNQAVRIPQEPFEKLSQYQFFTGELAKLQANDRVIPYDLNSPLFSDYAHKARFVWMPAGKSAKYTTGKVLEFPKETVLIKNFYYENDESDASKGRKIIETRLLINRGEEWEAIGYIWNEDQTEAYHEVVGEIKEVSWVDVKGENKSTHYIIPNKNQCKNCHLTGKKQIPIGPKVRNLNKNYPYADGEMNQLEKWASLGYLSGYDAEATQPKLARWEDETSGGLHDRAMAYLEINCGHCHNKEGAANTSGLHLQADTKLDMSLGIYKATVSAGAGTGGYTYSIVPGHPEESVMIYRMNSTNPGAMMPELGRSMVHDEGVSLISAWIKTLPQDKDKNRALSLQ